MNIVYCIKNLITNKYYVGSSSKFKVRKRQHLAELRKNKHHSSKLQNSWNKYGESSFQFVILEEVIDFSFLIEREQFWIDLLDSHRNGYNCNKKAGNYTAGEKHPMFGKAAHNKGSISPLRKKIVSYCVYSGAVDYFESVRSAADIFGPQFLGCISLDKIEKNKLRKFKDRFWFYLEDFSLDMLKIRFDLINAPFCLKGKKRPKEVGEKISKSLTGKKLSKEHIQKMSQNRLGLGGKKIVRSDGMEFNSIRQAGKLMGCCGSQISHVLSGKKKTCRGFGFSYLK
jgi:group I intron endonuclease